MAYSDFEYQINSEEVKDCTSYSISLLGKNIQIGDFKLRKKAMDGNPPSEWTYNTKAFFQHNGVPRVDITVSSINDINKNAKINGIIVFTNHNGSLYPEQNMFSGNISIKTRGNSITDKKGYAIELLDSLNVKIDFPCLQFPSANEWSFLQEYFDNSYLRNVTMLGLSKNVSPKWCPSAQTVELYINGTYNGVYTFCEKLERQTNRVQLSKLAITDVDLPKISGGYLMEVAIDIQENFNEITYFRTERTNPEPVYSTQALHSIKYPKKENLNQQQIDYITNYVQSFENALFNVSFSDEVNGYRAFLDIPSAVDYYLLQEFSKNCDGPSHSLFYTKDRSEKIKMGCIWDMDFSFSQIDSAFYPTGLYMNKFSWYAKLLEDEFFLNAIKVRYSEIRNILLTTLSDINNKGSLLNESGVAGRNRDLWGINSQLLTLATISEVYLDEVNRIKTFITNRINFLDTQFI